MKIYLVKLNWNPWQVSNMKQVMNYHSPFKNFPCTFDWLTDWFTSWLTGLLTNYLTDWLTEWLTGWFTDSLIACEWHFLIDAVWWPQTSDPDDKRQPGKKCAHHSFMIIHFIVMCLWFYYMYDIIIVWKISSALSVAWLIMTD